MFEKHVHDNVDVSRGVETTSSFGPFTVVTDPDGRIYLRSSEDGEAVDFSQMDLDDREFFFSCIFENAKIILAPHQEVQNTGGFSAQIFDNQQQQTLAEIKTHVIPRTGELFIDWISSEVRGGGLLLLSHILKETPEVVALRAELDKTNIAVYLSKRKEGLSHEESLRATPMYKVAARCGFSELVSTEGENQKADRINFKTIPAPVRAV